jgi:phenylalanyl-tRNA synthetase beta chain
MPAAEFDLAFLVPRETPAEKIESTLRSAGGELLERIVLFDEFVGQGVPDGQRSLAWRLTFRHPERTLNDKEISGRRQKLIATVEKEHGVVARTG